MDQPPKVVKLYRKKTKFNLAVLSITFVLFVSAILFIIGFGVVQKKTRKAPLLLNSDGVADDLYSEDEIDETYATSGYDFSGLQMPCVQEGAEGALPNLPESYKITNCNSLEKRVCVDNYVKGGGICLSALGGVCNSLYDCVQGADACINNICVRTSEFDTINQPCITDFECQSEGQNHVCDQKLKICKYNYFPYETGCQIDKDCKSDDQYNKNACVFIDSSGISIKATVTVGGFLADDQDNILFFKKGSAVSVLNDDNSFTIFNFTTNLVDGEFKTKKDPSKRYTVGEEKTLYLGNTGGQQLGICISKIPRGGKIIDIAGVKIPCEDGLINEDGVCVRNSFYSTYGVICDNTGLVDSLKCEPSVSQNAFSSVKLTCLGDVNVREQFSQNFNYKYPSLTNGESTEFRDEIKFLGYCSFPTQDLFESCDRSVSNCKKPYICITATDRGGGNFSFCSSDFNRQQCIINSECSDGYTCQENFCVSKPGNICLLPGDSENNECSSTERLYFYSKTRDKYFQVPGIDLSSHPVTPNIRFGKTINRVIDDYEFLPETFVLWSTSDVKINRPADYTTLNGYKEITENTYTGSRLNVTRAVYDSSQKKYVSKNFSAALYPETGVQFSDILVNDSGDMYSVYKKPAGNDRVRKSTILEFLADNYFTLPVNNGFIDGDRVVYRSNNPDLNNYSQTTSYYIYRDTTGTTTRGFTGYKYYLSTTEGGSSVAPDGDLVTTSEIVSYSNTYTIQIPENDGAPLDQAPILGRDFRTGDMVKLTFSGNLTINDYTFESGVEFYLIQTTGTEEYAQGDDSFNGYFYQLSSVYDSSVAFVESPAGTFNRTPFQRIYASGDVTVTLNPNLMSHSLALLNPDKSLQYLIKNEDFISGVRNGINAGFTYNFENNTTPTFNPLVGDQLLINQKLVHYDPSSPGEGNEDTIVITQKLTLSTTVAGEHLLASGVYSGGETTSTNFNFTYTNTASPPRPKYLYFDKNKESDENLNSEIVLNPLANEGDTLNILSGFTNSQNITVNRSPTLALTSQLHEVRLEEGDISDPPSMKYRENDLGADYIEMEIINIIHYDAPEKKNTYEIGTNELVFRDENDIELILKYGWSELVFMKAINNLSPEFGTAPSYEGNVFNGNAQVTLISVGILSYDVSLEGEILVVETNVPLSTENGSRNKILEAGNIWRMYPYNIYPLFYKRIDVPRSGGVIRNSRLYNFFDASGLYTSTKKKGYFSEQNIQNNHETSYNKIFTTNASDQSSSQITIIYVHDGIGYVENSDPYSSKKLVEEDSPYTVFLPNLVQINSFVGQSVTAPVNDYPPESTRDGGEIYSYFCSVSTKLLIEVSPSSINTNSSEYLNQRSYIRTQSDYPPTVFAPLSLQDISYIRPIHSGILWLKELGPSNQGTMYAVNNIYLSTIPKSITTAPYFNFNTMEIYYSITSEGRKKGDIPLGVDSVPYYPRTSTGDIVLDLDQSFEKITRWPSWILDNKLVVYKNVPIIEQVYLSTNEGNVGGKFDYYTLANINGKKNFYFFTSSNDRENLIKNQGVPVTDSVYNGEVSLSGVMFNPFFFLIAKEAL